MIISIDHLAVSSKNPNAVRSSLKEVGYVPVFSGQRFLNPRIKQGLMEEFCDYNELELLKKPGDIGIEIIEYGHTITREPPIIPIFCTKDSGCRLFEKTGEHEFDGSSFVDARLSKTEVPLLLEESTSFSFNRFIQYTSDIEQSVFFWSKLGFKELESKEGYSKLRFSSFFDRKPTVVYLFKKKVCHTLDVGGFNCVALVSNSVDTEIRNLSRFKIEITPKERVAVAGKQLDIAFARGPGGEIIEILGPAKEDD